MPFATLGFPNPGLQGFSPKLPKGAISSLAGLQDDPRHFQISLAIGEEPSRSGKPDRRSPKDEGRRAKE